MFVRYLAEGPPSSLIHRIEALLTGYVCPCCLKIPRHDQSSDSAATSIWAARARLHAALRPSPRVRHRRALDLEGHTAAISRPRRRRRRGCAAGRVRLGRGWPPRSGRARPAPGTEAARPRRPRDGDPRRPVRVDITRIARHPSGRDGSLSLRSDGRSACAAQFATIAGGRCTGHGPPEPPRPPVTSRRPATRTRAEKTTKGLRPLDPPR